MEYNLVKGFVTHVTDPSNFWLRICTEKDMNLFNEYQQRLNNHYNKDLEKYSCTIDEFQPGFLVVVAVSPLLVFNDTTENTGYHWERAQVTRVMSNTTADVFFVDMGYTSIVELDVCRIIPPNLFHYLKPQAYRASLIGIKPLSNSWTSKATDFMLKKTLKTEVVVLLIHYDHTGGSYSVVIYTKETDGIWKSLVHEMQHMELGLTAGLNIEEVLTDEMVNEVLQKIEECQIAIDSEDGGYCEPDDRDETLMSSAVINNAVENLEEVGRTSASDNFLKSVENTTVEESNQGLTSNKSPVVTGFDYRSLMQSHTVSASKLQNDMTKDQDDDQTKLKAFKGMQRFESDPGQSDEQDWDAVQDTGFHNAIVSQIYEGVMERQYSEDDNSVVPKTNEVLADGGLNINDNFRQTKDDVNEVPEKSPTPPLSEVDSYLLEKQIEEILINGDENGPDNVFTSIYSVIEPDADAPQDHLQVVICAILEYILQNPSCDTEMAFTILETYSDAHNFGNGMIQVIDIMKCKFLRLQQSERLKDNHKKFAHVLSLVFKQAEDWNKRVCQDVQHHIFNLVERWTVFNKQRHKEGVDSDKTELMFLEVVATFLDNCFDVLTLNFGERLELLMEETRFKLLQDGTSRSVRELLLNLILSFYTEPFMQKKVTISTASQTDTDPTPSCPISMNELKQSESQPSVTDQEMSAVHFDNQASQQHNSSNRQQSCHENLDISEFVKRKNIPKSIKNLPPRLLKKYLLDHPNEYTNSFSDQNKNMNFASASICTIPDPDVSKQISQMTGTSNLIYQSKNIDHHEMPSTEENDEPNQSVVNDGKEPKLSSEPLFSPLNEIYENVLQSSKVYDSSEFDAGVLTVSKDSYAIPESLVVDNIASPIQPDSIQDQPTKTLKSVKNSLHDGVKSDIGNKEVEVKIRYTPDELRALNQYLGQPKIPLWDLWEPKEVLEKMITMVNPGRENEKDNHSTKWSHSRLSRLDTNDEEFRTPESPCHNNFEVVYGSSVDPTPVNSNCDRYLKKNYSISDPFMDKGNIYMTKNKGNDNSLGGIAAQLLDCQQDVDVNKSCGDEETWHDDAAEANSGELLKPKRLETPSRKAKKKRSRGRPLDEFLFEQRNQSEDVEIEDQSNDDESHLSKEMLQHYEELEQEGVGLDTGLEGARILISSKVGTHISSSSKRSSAICLDRSGQSGKALKSWTPKRFCTRCGSEDHIVYDCKTLTSRLTL